MPKSYVILCQQNGQGITLIFPFKRDDVKDYPGMPQFFGGTWGEKDKNDFDAIERELEEESNDEYSLVNATGLELVYKNEGVGFKFFLAGNALGEKQGAIENTEMKSLKRLPIKTGELKSFNCDELLKKLGITPSPDFTHSETKQAFDGAFQWLNDPKNASKIKNFVETSLE